jgi:O-antigen ligase
MQALILVIIGVAMSSDFLVQSLALPSITRFLPELLSGIVIVYVVVAGTRDRFRMVAPKYWLFFAALTLVTLCGIIINNPGPGPVISGLRFYFRGAPLFLLAAVLPMSEDNLQRQLKLLLGLAFIQLPVSAYQRWVVFSEDRYSGDSVQGTLMDSGILSMFLICAVLVLTGLLLKRRIGKLLYATLFLILLIPTTINETKVTVVFLPLGLFVTLLVGAEPGKRLRYAGIGLMVLVIFGAIFVPVYNMMQERDHYKVDIVDFFTNEQELDKYLISNNNNGHTAGLGTQKPAHRGEAIAIPIKYLSKDPSLLAFGLGLGNVSPSTLGKNFQGSYNGLFQSVLIISFAFFLLEFGLLGVILFGLLFWMIFIDSVAVARHDKGLTAALAAGWTGVIAVFMLATFYNSFHYFTSLTFLYWYLSGVICARRMSLARETERVSHPVAHPQPSPIG